MSTLARVIKLEKFAKPKGEIGSLSDAELDGLIVTLKALQPGWPVSTDIISMSMADLGLPMSARQTEALIAEAA